MSIAVINCNTTLSVKVGEISMIELRRNMLLTSEDSNGDRRVKRVLSVSDDGQSVWTINIERKNWPVKESYDEIIANIQAGESTQLDRDPFLEELNFSDIYRSKHESEQKANWKMIRHLIHDASCIDEQDDTDISSDIHNISDNDNANDYIIDIEISEAIFDPAVRSRFVDSIAKQYKTSQRRVYELLGRAFRSGFNPDSMFPALNRCGGPGQSRPATANTPKRGRPTKAKQPDHSSIGVNLTEYVKDSFERGYEVFFLKEKAKSLAECFRRILIFFFYHAVSNQFGLKNVPTFINSTRLPNIDQFYAWHDKHCDRLKELEIRHGQGFVRANRRARRGKVFHMARGPGACYMLDATILDVYLRSALDPNVIIGRPVLYTLVDVATWTIAGFHVDLGTACPETAFLAIENAICDKVAYCAQYGVPISKWQWPTEGIPKSIYIDRSELRGQATDNMMQALGIMMATAPAYRPDWKSMVERWFRLLNDLGVHALPGTTYTLEGREGYDYRLDAQLTLDELRRVLIYIILAHNIGFKLDLTRLGKQAIEDNVPPYPSDFWEWGIRNRSGCLQWADPRIVRLNLLPRGKARVTADGLMFKPPEICRAMPERLQYSCMRTSLEPVFERIRTESKAVWIDIVYEPRLVDYIYRRLDNGRDFEEFHLHTSYEHFNGMSWEEVNDFYLRDAQKQPDQTVRTLNALALVDAAIRQTIRESRRQRPKLKMSKRNLRLQIKAGRDAERLMRRKQNAWELSRFAAPTQTLEQLTQSIEAPPQPQVDAVQQRRLEQLEAARRRKLGA